MMFSMSKKCLCKGLLIGMSVGITIGFVTNMITTNEKNCDIKKKINKAIKAANSLLQNF